MALLEQLNRDGFVIIRDILSPQNLQALRAATQSVTAFARSGKWPDVRTLPKQFPPWKTDKASPAADGIWGVQSLMHPDMPHQADFLRTYFSDAIIAPTKELLQCAEDELVMELFNLLVHPDHDFELRWHRDDIPATATPSEELDRLGKPAYSAQWNLALYDDSSLVVPGSHLRARTEVERAADPFEKVLPDQLVVKLRAGDIVFYNIIHRGVYSSGTERMTLHGSAGHIHGAKLRATNVLQHGLRDWPDRLNFDALDARPRALAEKMRTNLVNMGQGVGDVGYSLVD